MSGLAFDLTKVRKQYPHFTLHDVDLSLPRGSIMGFVGPNGAGKSTTIRILMGLVGFDSGRVELLGRSLPDGHPWARQRIGFVSEDMGLYASATVGWHLDFVSRLYSTWDTAYADALLRRFKLIREQKVKQLSHGQRVKAGLLLALARRPQLLILDEPSTGLDPVARQEVVGELLETLQLEEHAVFFSSHHTHDVEQVSDLITFIHEGRILESDNKEAFLERWRRLRLDVDPAAKISLPGDCECITREGRHCVLATGQFSEQLMQSLKAIGASILEVQRMSLEEIFVTRVGLPGRRWTA